MVLPEEINWFRLPEQVRKIKDSLSTLLKRNLDKAASGRISYFNQSLVSFTANTPKKLNISWNNSREVNVKCDTSNNQIEVLLNGEYLCYGMVTFTGSNNTKYDLQLRKNDQLICTCNPQTEVLQGRELNLTSIDISDFSKEDKLSLWMVSSKTESVQVQRAKLIIKK